MMKNIISSFVIIAIKPRTAPMERLPTSPINILAGFRLKVRKPAMDPIKAQQKNINSR